MPLCFIIWRFVQLWRTQTWMYLWKDDGRTYSSGRPISNWSSSSLGQLAGRLRLGSRSLAAFSSEKWIVWAQIVLDLQLDILHLTQCSFTVGSSEFWVRETAGMERIPYACLERRCCPDCSNPRKGIWSAWTRQRTYRLSYSCSQGTCHCCTSCLGLDPRSRTVSIWSSYMGG